MTRELADLCVVEIVNLFISSACDACCDICVMPVIFVWVGIFIHEKNNKNSHCLVTSPCAVNKEHSKVTISVHSGQHFVVCWDTAHDKVISLCHVPFYMAHGKDSNFVVCFLTGTWQSCTPRAITTDPRRLLLFFAVCRRKHMTNIFSVCPIKGTRQSLLRRPLGCRASFAVGGHQQMLWRALYGLCRVHQAHGKLPNSGSVHLYQKYIKGCRSDLAEKMLREDLHQHIVRAQASWSSS